MVKRAVSVIGDITSLGGIVEDTDNIIAHFMGKNVANIGDSATCPVCKKARGKIIQIGERQVQIEGKQIAVENDIVACGCPFGSHVILKQQDVIHLDIEIKDASEDPNYKHLLGRPSFNDLAQAYWEISDKTSTEAFEQIGGNLYELHINDKTDAFQNSCASRLSYAFHHSGHNIPSGTINPNKNIKRFAGNGGLAYIVQVDAFGDYIDYQYGGYDNHITDGNLTSITGKKGIISIDMRGGNSTGHITLWDGYNTLDDSLYHTSYKNIKFLELP